VKLTDRIAYRFLKNVLCGRLEPFEGTLAFSALTHGVLLTFNISNSAMIFAPKLDYMGIVISCFVGGIMMASGIAVIMFNYGRFCRMRRAALMAQFIGWASLFFAVLFNPFSNIVVNMAYATIAILSSIVYLGVSAEEASGE
jgi:hypothetical protein